jgi:hypothetical protein
VSALARVAAAVGILLAAAAPARALDAGDRTIAQGRVGAIVKTTPPEDLAKIYGADKVHYGTIVAAEGEEHPGAKIMPGTDDAIEVIFSDDKKRIENITIVGKRWASKEGIRIGTPLAALEKINGGPFQLYGFGWDYGGTLLDGPKGRLPRYLTIVVTPTRNQSSKEYRRVIGEKKISSRDPALRDLGVAVSSISIGFAR